MTNIKLISILQYLLLSTLAFASNNNNQNNQQPDPCESQKCVKLIPEETGAPIELPLAAAKFSLTIKNMIDDFGEEGQLPEEGIPIKVKTPVLSHIVNVLVKMQKMQEKNKPFDFNPIKRLIKKSYSNIYSKDDILNFLIAANYLDIYALLRPAAALWVDLVILEKLPTNDGEWAKIKEQVPSDLPRELLPVFNDYIMWLKYPSLKAIDLGENTVLDYITGNILLKILNKEQKRQCLELFKGPSTLAVLGNNLYVATRHFGISVIDTAQDKTLTWLSPSIGPNATVTALAAVGDKLYKALGSKNIVEVTDTSAWFTKTPTTITVGKWPGAFAELGNKLYVANQHGRTISVIDTLTDQLVGQPIVLGSQPRALAVRDNKLYVANYYSNTVSIIDTATDKLVGEPIAVGKHPSALAISDNKLYVANQEDDTISTIDTTIDQVVGQPIVTGSQPSALAVFDDELYVANQKDGTISIIDKATEQVIGQPIVVKNLPCALAVADNKLYVSYANDSSTISNFVSVLELLPASLFRYYGNK